VWPYGSIVCVPARTAASSTEFETSDSRHERQLPARRQEHALAKPRRLLFDGRLSLFTKGQYLAGHEERHREGLRPGADGGFAPDVYGVPQTEDSEHRCQAGEPNPSSTVHPLSMKSGSSGHACRPSCCAARPRIVRIPRTFGRPLIDRSAPSAADPIDCRPALTSSGSGLMR